MQFVWYDYETFSLNPSHARIAQFAAIITDQKFQPINQPIVLYGKLPNDFIPEPQSIIITGLTPQEANRQGLTEAALSQQIHQLFNKPGNCVVGYNNIRFDDEVTRFLFYRNFYDSYEHEYRNQNSRWDLLDTTRFIHALAPETLNWPKNQQGNTSFKLEHLSEANDFIHDKAHDALSDVQATITLAKTLQIKQPQLFEHAFQLRKKTYARQFITTHQNQPLLHVSGKIPAKQGHADLIYPLVADKQNANKIYVISLHSDMDFLLQASIPELAAELFNKTEVQQETRRIRIKGVHLNRSPILAPLNWLNSARAEQLHIDLANCTTNFIKLTQLSPSDKTALSNKITELFTPTAETTQTTKQPTDIEQQLYSGGFFSEQDKYLLREIHQIHIDQQQTGQINKLLSKTYPFTDPRLPELLWRYRARNFPASLSTKEQQQWQQERYLRITTNPLYNLDHFCNDWANLYHQYKNNPDKLSLLEAAKNYVKALCKDF